MPSDLGQNVCPTCGSPVRVVTGDEGTSHYEPRQSDARAWKAYPARQVTGVGRQYRGYVTREYGERADGEVYFVRAERLCHEGYHRTPEAAQRCAERTARRLNG